MVLIDTSVWIRFLMNRTPFSRDLEKLLERDEVIGHELVYGELLIGDSGGRRTFLAAYERIHQAATLRHREIVEFARHRRLHGRGIGWIDTHLLAAALVEGCDFWTVDSPLCAVAAELGIAYKHLDSGKTAV